MRKLRRVARTRSEIHRDRRYRRGEIDDFLFGIWLVFALFVAPMLAILGMLGVLG